MCVADERRGASWWFFGIYGWPESQHKWKTGQLVSDLKPGSPLPWLVGGDLNEIFFHCEKKSGPPKSQVVLDNFRSSFLDNGLYDLGLSVGLAISPEPDGHPIHSTRKTG